MSDKETKAPEFLQIKGYKYRARILIAAAVILVVFLIIIISIIHGITSGISSKNKPADTDVKSNVTQSYSSDIDSDSDTVSNESDVVSEKKLSSKEKFDADGKLIIDTDTLDGKKAVALTFDDGPGEYTSDLIEGLNERGAKATFFMVGSCVDQYPDVLPQMVSGGHQLGNHTYNHTDITSVSNKEMNDQISKTDKAVYNACGQYPTAFRPPYGSCNDNTNMVIIDKTITLWSVDTVDWSLKNSKDVKDTIVSQCKDGDIILMHDIYKSTVDGALLAIDELQKQGFVFVTVDELLSRYGYEIERKKPHSSQYAVYETNSPYAEKYLKEINSQKAERAASSAAKSFYDERSQKPSDSDNSNKSSDSDTNTSRLIY